LRFNGKTSLSDLCQHFIPFKVKSQPICCRNRKKLPPNKKFQILRVFPKRNNHILLDFGKAMVAEKKMLSSESVGFSGKAGRR
jgi:hypothetical protein